MMMTLPESSRSDGLLTIGEIYNPAMRVEDREDAQQYLDQIVTYMLRVDVSLGCDSEKAMLIVKQNIGYYSGYYDPDTMVRVQDLFDCAHPIFGRARTGKPIDPQDALQAGAKIGTAATD